MPQCLMCGSPALGRVCQNCLRITNNSARTKVLDKNKFNTRPTLFSARTSKEKARALGVTD